MRFFIFCNMEIIPASFSSQNLPSSSTHFLSPPIMCSTFLACTVTHFDTYFVLNVFENGIHGGVRNIKKQKASIYFKFYGSSVYLSNFKCIFRSPWED